MGRIGKQVMNGLAGGNKRARRRPFQDTGREEFAAWWIEQSLRLRSHCCASKTAEDYLNPKLAKGLNYFAGSIGPGGAG